MTARRPRRGRPGLDGHDVVGLGDRTGVRVPAEERRHGSSDTGFARHAFGAQFAEARVDPGTGEIRVSRPLGVFAVGRIIDPVLARSQFIGGMTMGLGMAKSESSAPRRS